MSTSLAAESISLAMQELKRDIDNVVDATKKEVAELNFELLNANIESKNKDKATGIVEKIKNIIGNTSSLITIGTFLAGM